MESMFSPISEENRKFRFLRGSEIILEGLIGAGKSTLGISLETYLNKIGLKAKFFPEFRHDELLKLYIADMKKYAFCFQAIIVRERLRIYEEAQQFAESGGISIIDRGLLGDFTFALMQKDKGFISEEEYNVYWKLVTKNFKTEPFITLYLDCAPEIAFERMKKRNIESETNGYTLSYFETLKTAYEKSLSQNHCKIIRIPWNSDYEVNGKFLIDDICYQVLSFID